MSHLADIRAVDQASGPDWAIYQGDSCELLQAIPTGTICYGIHSPPFEGLYKFSNFDRDLSNSEGGAFWDHYGFIIRELLRVTMPGRLHSVHVMQLPMSKIRHGHIGMRDFRGETVRAYQGDEAAEIYSAMRLVRDRAAEAAVSGDRRRARQLAVSAERIERDLRAHPGRGGWIFHSEVCIWKDPVVAQQRTKSIRLLHKQVMKDSTLSGQGLADYVLTFRKPGENPEAIDGMFDGFVGTDLDISREAYDRHAGATRADGREPWPYDQWVSILVWQRYASPVWMDIDQTRTLQNRRWNPAARDERDGNDEQHISPLQLDVIERCIDLWSNPGDTVLTPFLGIGSEVWAAANMGRRGVGIELKPTYFAQALRNLRALPSLHVQPEPDALLIPMGVAAE